jgi:hypothetical protein
MQNHHRPAYALSTRPPFGIAADPEISTINTAAKTIQEKIREAFLILAIPPAIVAIGVLIAKIAEETVKTGQYVVVKYRGYEITHNRGKMKESSGPYDLAPPDLLCIASISSPKKEGDPVGSYSAEAVTCKAAVTKVKKYIDKMLKEHAELESRG